MISLEPGQKVSLDVSGLRLPGAALPQLCTDGIIVDVAPGVITVRLELEDGEHLITVSPQRIE